jgi:hypothetical protein
MLRCSLADGALRIDRRLPVDNLGTRDLIPDARIQGYEDMRLFRWRGSLWAVATVCDRNPDCRAEIALLDLCTKPDGVLVWDCRVLDCPEPELHQKNWVPIGQSDGPTIRRTDENKNENLLLIYRADPTAILEVAPDGSCGLREEPQRPDLALDGLRGGSQAIPFDLDGRLGYLYVAHEAFDCGGGRRWYTHRFVWLDEGLRIQHVSDPFYLYVRGVEFVAGLARVGEELLLTFGVEDCRAMYARAPAERVKAWLLRRKTA